MLVYQQFDFRSMVRDHMLVFPLFQLQLLLLLSFQFEQYSRHDFQKFDLFVMKKQFQVDHHYLFVSIQ